jgi:anti-sigma-K factor RskA
MDLHRHAGLVDQLAAEYTLGVMRGRSRRRFETIAQGDPAIRVAIETWRGRVEAIGELAPQVAPPPSVWEAIERRLSLGGARREAVSARPASRWFENLSFWRGWSIAATAVAALALVISLRQLTPTPVPAPQVAQEPHVGYVAALADKDAHPAILVTWDDRTSEVTVRRLSGASDPTDKSMQLWGLPKEGHPVSLGVLPAGGTARFKAASVNAFPALAVSVEPLGGSPNPDGPTGPVVYTGKVIPGA